MAKNLFIKKFWETAQLWKKVLLGAALVFAVITVLDFTGYVQAGIKSWVFEFAYKERMKKIEELQKENDKLRKEMVELEKLALEIRAKDAVLEYRQRQLDAKTKEELERLDMALEDQAREEAITQLPVDNRTRCERLKAKMLALKIKAAEEIDCNEY